MKTTISETIDGSMKDIIQLKTLDSSLEYSQLFDALDDCPQDFKAKLIGALNSLGQTMGIPATDVFNQVLCASEDENAKKKLYNWWRAVFEVVSKSVPNIPEDRRQEYEEKLDALISEICKAGDKASGNDVVLEDYEPADIEEEDKLKEDMTFAASKIGEVAKKAEELVNFLNPYCGTEVNESTMDETEVRDFVKAIGFRPDSDGIDYETQLVDALTGKDTSYNAGWGAIYYNSDKVLQFLKKYGMLGSRGIKQKEAISKLKRLFKSGKWKSPQQDELFNEVDNTMKKIDERGGSDWVSMDDMIGMEVGESEEQTGEFQVGDKVMWIDPDKGYPSDGWTVEDVSPGKHPSGDDLYIISRGKSSVMNIRGSELRSEDDDTLGDADVDEAPDMYSDDEETFKDVYRESDDEEKIVIANAKKTAKKDGYDQYILFDKSDNSWAFERKHIQTKDDFAKFGQEVVGIVRAEDLKFVPFALESDDGGKAFWKAMDKVDDLEKKGYWKGIFKVGDKVSWIDPEYDEITSGWTVVSAPDEEDAEELLPEEMMYTIENDDGSEAEVFGCELRPALETVMESETEPLDEYEFLDKMLEDAEDTNEVFDVYDGNVIEDGTVALNVTVYKDDVEDGEVEAEFKDMPLKYGWKYDCFMYSSDVPGEEGTESIVVYFRPQKKRIDEMKNENELDIGDDGWREIGQPVDEATVTVDANDVWDVLDLLDDEEANKNLTALINSHVRTEDEIMDAIDTVYPDNIRKGELNLYMKDSFGEIVSELGLDVNKFKETGEFVDPEKPVALEGSTEDNPDEVKDGEKKYKQDGETKTLDFGENKKPVCEMTIEQEVTDPWKLLELLWGQGKENFEELLRSNLFSDDMVMDTLEQFEVKNLTNLNDLLAYDFEQVLDAFGCDVEAWTQHLEIQKA